MRDSSDEFFNNWEASPPQPNRRPPPPPGRPPPPAYEQSTTTTSRTPPPPAKQSNYVLQQPPALQTNNYYAAPPSPQPQYHSQPPQPASPHNHNDGWYQPQYQQQYQQQPQYQYQQQPPMIPHYQPQSNYGYDMHGSMDGSNRGMAAAPVHTFVPGHSPDYIATEEEQEEAPLLEELGINVEHIFAKTKAVIIPFRRFQKNSILIDPSMIVEDADLAGPLAFALLLGGELLMSGKIQFGYIYGFGLFGCVSMTLMLNLMSVLPISFWTVTSILGYSLLPVNVLALLKILTLGYFTKVLAVFTVIWSTTASTRLLEIGCNMGQQRYLLAYPLALLYSAFVLITIF